MKFTVSSELDYSSFEPCILILNIHATRNQQQIVDERFLCPGLEFTELSSFPDQNRLIKIKVNTPGQVHCSYKATVETSYTVIDCEGVAPVPVWDLEPGILNYLNPSRYCQSDKLYRFANHQFGRIENDFEKVFAITEWIHTNVEYLSGSTNAETSAYDTVTQQAGVCRDFAHLGIALCRALTIPARYCAAYAYQLYPQDFHACFEAFIAGSWIVFDATKLVALNSLVKIAVGRDAADAAVANLFGNIQGNSIIVDCQLADENFQAFYYLTGNSLGISYG